MIRSIVVDDQKSFLKSFREMTEQHFSERLKILAECRTHKAALHAIHTFSPDLIFLNIEPEHESGFDLLDKLPANRPEVVFTTAYEKYAIRAIRFKAIDYLLKPFGPHDLGIALDRFDSFNSMQGPIRNVGRFETNLKVLSDPHKKIAIPTAHGFEILSLGEIVYIRSNNSYTVSYLVNGNEFIITHPLKDYEELLEEYNFCRVHQSYLINMDHIRSYSRIDGGRVIMSNGMAIEVSRRKRDDFLKRLQSIIR